jgi:hypothetical protein
LRRFVVLNDHERRTLREVEQQIMVDDPEFVCSFQARQARLQRDPRRRGAAIAAGVAILLAVFMLLAGSLTGAIASAVTTVLIWAVWHSSTGTASRTNLSRSTDDD